MSMSVPTLLTGLQLRMHMQATCTCVGMIHSLTPQRPARSLVPCAHVLFQTHAAGCPQSAIHLDTSALNCGHTSYDPATCTLHGTDCYFKAAKNNATLDLTACPLPSGQNSLRLSTLLVNEQVAITCASDFQVVQKAAQDAVIMPEGYVLPSVEQVVPWGDV